MITTPDLNDHRRNAIMTRSLSRRRFLQSMAASSAVLPLAGQLLADEPRKAANDASTWVSSVSASWGGATWGLPRHGRCPGRCRLRCRLQRREHAQKMVEDRYGKDKKGEYKGCASVQGLPRTAGACKGLDAVLIATPDHWHNIPCILAARAGKHIYCEKPLTHDIAEGRRLVDEVARAKIIFQTGSQQRSEFGNHFRLAVELIRNGRIGKVSRINIGVGGPGKSAICPPRTCPKGPTGISGWGRPPHAVITRCSVPRAFTTISRPGATTWNLAAAAWPTWR